MNIQTAKFLADENLPQVIVNQLKTIIDIRSVADVSLINATDTTILNYSSKENLIVITQDRDFGKLIYSNKTPFIGIIYLRPGHLKPEVTMETMKFILEKVEEVLPPFILVAHYSDSGIFIRLRNQITIL